MEGWFEGMGTAGVRVCFLRVVGVMLHRKSRLRGGLSLYKTKLSKRT